MLALSLVTAIALYVGFSAIIVASLFLLCVCIHARHADFWSSAILSAVAAFALAFFFTPPGFSFGIAKPLDAIVVLAFLIIAFVQIHLAVLHRAQLKEVVEVDLSKPGGPRASTPTTEVRIIALIGHGANVLIVAAILLISYGLAWTYATHRYLKGFADAIVPLEGSALDKSQALLSWLRHEPERADSTLDGPTSLRDPVNIVQNARLLKYCGSATNAFMNLADVAGVSTRRLLLLDGSGSTKHVLAEVESEGKWIVVDPSLGLVFRNRSGIGLSKEQLRDVKVFKEAISRMPGYKSSYTFEHTAHINLKRIPRFGDELQQTLDGLDPGWDEEINWGYLPENPSLWPLVISFPLLCLGILVQLVVNRNGRPSAVPDAVRFREQLVKSGRIARI